jgi:hypothetical protein
MAWCEVIVADGRGEGLFAGGDAWQREAGG